MTDRLEHTLPAALRRLAHDAPTPPLDGAAIRRRVVRQRRWTIGLPVAVVVVLAAVVTSLSLFRPHSVAPAGPAAASVCAPLQTGPLPPWARSGFSSGNSVPFATSSRGDVVAVVFAHLISPSPPGHNNKILWVHRYGQADLASVTARLEGTDRTTHLSLPYGPSTVDMPAPGCWHLEWGTGADRDSINLRWSKP